MKLNNKRMVVAAMVGTLVFTATACATNEVEQGEDVVIEQPVVKNDIVGVWINEQNGSLMELTEEGRIIDAGQDVAGYEVLGNNEVKIMNEGQEDVVISYEFDGEKLLWGTNFEAHQTYTGYDEAAIEIDGEESEETSGEQALMADHIMTENMPEAGIETGETVLVRLPEGEFPWFYEVSLEGVFDLMDTNTYTDNNGVVMNEWLFQVNRKGENTLYFSQEDADHNRVVELSFQVLTYEYANTEGNVVEYTGIYKGYEMDSLILNYEDDKEFYIYNPEGKVLVEGLDEGQEIIVGGVVGEASLQLAFVKPVVDMTTEEGKEFKQHIGQVAGIEEPIEGQFALELLVKEDALFVNATAEHLEDIQVGDAVYVECMVDPDLDMYTVVHIEVIQ